MEELLKIEQELKRIIEEGNRRISEYQEEIRIAKENEEEANEEVIRARNGEDARAYADAIEKKKLASNIAEYYHGKIKQLKAKPYITEEEYRVYTRRINEEMDKINSEGKARASKLFDELKTIKEDIAPAYIKTNNLLRELQNNIYKSSYEKTIREARENKTPLNTSDLHNEYKDNSLIVGIDYVLSQAEHRILNNGGK